MRRMWLCWCRHWWPNDSQWINTLLFTPMTLMNINNTAKLPNPTKGPGGGEVCTQLLKWLWFGPTPSTSTMNFFSLHARCSFSRTSKLIRTAPINHHGCGCVQTPLEERIQCSKKYVQTLASLAIEYHKSSVVYMFSLIIPLVVKSMINFCSTECIAKLTRGRFRLWPNFERRRVWTNENVELPKVRPLGLHTRGRNPKDVASKRA
jgi:hypothetical protein